MIHSLGSGQCGILKSVGGHGQSYEQDEWLIVRSDDVSFLCHTAVEVGRRWGYDG